MKKFDVYAHPDGRLEAVKQGWNWVAFLFAPMWLPYKRLWPQTYAIYFFIITPITRKWPESLEALANLIVFGISIYFGFKGYNAVAGKLKKKGFEYAATVEAETKDAALAAHLKKVQATSKRQTLAQSAKVSAPPATATTQEPTIFNQAITATQSPAVSINDPSMPPRLTTPPPIKQSLSAALQHQLLNLNNASEDQIANLPGVGPILAKKAVAILKTQGGFQSIEHFGEALGIKAHYLDRIRLVACVMQ